VVVDNDYLNGRKLYGQVTTTYRYGREEDEVMGVKFSKEFVVTRQQLVPPTEKKTDLTPIQVTDDISTSTRFSRRSEVGPRFQGKKLLRW
jgi:hypothetical protein